MLASKTPSLELRPFGPRRYVTVERSVDYNAGYNDWLVDASPEFQAASLELRSLLFAKPSRRIAIMATGACEARS